jgi:hypothetical protein
LRDDAPHVGQPGGERKLSPGTTVVRNTIQIVDRCRVERAEAPGERRLATARPPDDVDARDS